jgi:hypothetical protein
MKDSLRDEFEDDDEEDDDKGDEEAEVFSLTCGIEKCPNFNTVWPNEARLEKHR